MVDAPRLEDLLKQKNNGLTKPKEQWTVDVLFNKKLISSADVMAVDENEAGMIALSNIDFKIKKTKV